MVRIDSLPGMSRIFHYLIRGPCSLRPWPTLLDAKEPRGIWEGFSNVSQGAWCGKVVFDLLLAPTTAHRASGQILKY